MIKHNSTFLRRALAVDAIASGVIGLLLLAASSPLAALLGISAAFLASTGLVLLPFAFWVGWLAKQANPPRRQVWAIVVINALWVLDSVALLIVGPFDPTALGVAFVLVQAAAVFIFMELEYIGVRRAAGLAQAAA
jgi:hypothetical protein